MGLTDVLDRSRCIAPANHDRWRMPPAALAIYLAIGQVFALSTLTAPFTRLIGVSSSAPQDWSASAVSWLFPVAITFLGISAFVFSRWIDAVGPRKAMFASASCFAAGFLITAVGARMHIIGLVYFGYGVVGGTGLGLGYASPVTALIRWFPDRPAAATGLAIAGFAGGALVGQPFAQMLLDYFSSATDTGVVSALVTMGVSYFAFMMFGVFTIRLPEPGWTPASYTSARREAEDGGHWAPRVGTPAGRSDAERRPVAKDVHVTVATRTRQFWLLALIVGLSVAAGAGVLSQASPAIQDLFPGMLGAAAAAGFIAVLALTDTFGRALWAAWTDGIGRRRAFLLYLSLSAALLAYAPTAAATPSIVAYVTCVALALAMCGGLLAALPAYVRDLFGDLHVGPIHARLLIAWSAGAVAGPALGTLIRKFQLAGGVTSADSYRWTIYAMAGLLVIALIANWLLRAVDPRHHFQPTEPTGTAGGGRR